MKEGVATGVIGNELEPVILQLPLPLLRLSPDMAVSGSIECPNQ